jgi:hypothetical protein
MEPRAACLVGRCRVFLGKITLNLIGEKELGEIRVQVKYISFRSLVLKQNYGETFFI